MTNAELGQMLETEGVRYFVVNGFQFRHSGTDYAVLEGRIPLSLARKIHKGIDNSKLQICVHGNTIGDKPEDWAINAELKESLCKVYEKWEKQKDFSLKDVYEKARRDYIKKVETEERLDDIYILYYHIHTKEGIQHVVKCIRESGYVNQCLYR